MSTIRFHVASLDEKKAIMSKVDRMFGERVASNTIGRLDMILAIGKRVELFLVTSKLMETFIKIQAKHNPYCLGVYFGDIRNNELLPSIEGATLCSPYTDRKIRVSHKGEQAVLYGRDVQRSYVQDFPSPILRGQKVIIVNELREVLALGNALVNGKEFHDASENSPVAKNIIDRGWYLRKGE